MPTPTKRAPTSPSSVMEPTTKSATVDTHQLDASSPEALKLAGNKALAEKDNVRASRMYTLAIDVILRGSKPPSEAPKPSELKASDWYELDRTWAGVLSACLSNRSLTQLQAEDAVGAAEDAEWCCLANPGWPKGHLRLLAALEPPVGAGSIAERRAACQRGLRACPGSVPLREAKGRIEAAAVEEREAGKGGGEQERQATLAVAEVELAAQMQSTRLVASDEKDPRRYMAAGDLGTALALGAHGMAKDVEEAEVWLKLGAEGGDLASQRHLGLLYIEQGRGPEAAAWLQRAAKEGDGQAAEELRKLADEAREQQEQARAKLGMLASRGDERARRMLEQLKEDPEGLLGGGVTV